MKFSIGTAQLGMRYGVYKRKINSKEILKIKKIILKNNIQFIDTASSYGNSEKILGKNNFKKFKIITKFKVPYLKKEHIKNWLEAKVNQTLKNLKSKKIYGVLIHNYQDLYGQKGKEYLKELIILKKKKIIQNIGISIYEPKELEFIWKFWKPDIVQAPLNVIDNRLINSGWLNKLKKSNVKVQVRSIFLQGLLINGYNKVLFKKEKKYLDHFFDWCKNMKISSKLACIHFIKQQRKIDHVVIGVDEANHLKEIINIFKKKQIKIPNKFYSNNIKLIDPRRWI